MAAPDYDERDWPLLRVVLSSDDMNDAEFMTFVATLDGLPRRGDRFAVLLDVRSAPPLVPSRRQLLAKHGDAAYARHPGAMAGMAIVMTSALQRGIFTAIQWMMRKPSPVRAFASSREAEAWLGARLRESGARPLAPEG